MYQGYKDVKRVLDGLGIAILSTSKGVMSDRQARAAGHGGVDQLVNDVDDDLTQRPPRGRVADARRVLQVWSTASRTTIGTANVDRLSMTGNYEINVEIIDESLAEEMERIY